MKFLNVLYMLKMVCGENLKCVYGYGGGWFFGGVFYFWMGNVVGYCMVWVKVVEYKCKWDKYVD